MSKNTKKHKSTKTHVLTTIATATILSATVVSITSCSIDTNIAKIDHSTVSCDTQEINVISGKGQPVKANFTGNFLDKNGNKIDSKVKWITNIDQINYYGDLPEGVITFVDGVLTVDPTKLTDPLYEGSCEVVVWAQTTAGSLKQEKMESYTLEVRCNYDTSVPRSAEMNYQETKEVGIACGGDVKVQECKFGIQYYSSIIGELTYDNTNWTVEDRGGLSDEIKLSMSVDPENPSRGILKIDATQCHQSFNGAYTLTIKGQSKTSPKVYATAKIIVDIIGDAKVVTSDIIGESDIAIDAKVPTIYTNFEYTPEALNIGNEIINNAPFNVTLDQSQLDVLTGDGIDVKMKDNKLLVDASNAKQLNGKEYPLQITATPWVNAQAASTKLVTIKLNKFDNTAANIGLSGEKQIVVAAASADDKIIPYSCYLENKTHAPINTETNADIQLDLAPDEEQDQRFVRSGIKYELLKESEYNLKINTKEIDEQYWTKTTNFQIKLIATYADGSTSLKTEHIITLSVNPQNSAVVSSTLIAEGPTSVRAIIGSSNSVTTPTFYSTLLALNKQPLAGYTPVLSVTSSPTLPEEIKISFEQDGDGYKMLVDASDFAPEQITNTTYNLSVGCHEYYDPDTKSTLPISEVQTVGIELTVSDSRNIIKTVENQEIVLNNVIDPNIFCATLKGNDYCVTVVDKDNQSHEILTKNITALNIGLCDPSVVSIYNNFLRGCTQLETINLVGLENIISIGDHFLEGGNTSTLKEVDFSPLAKVKTIGSGFLYSQKAIEKVNLSSLSDLRTIGDYFLFYCDKLKNVDLSSSKITEVGYNFINWYQTNGIEVTLAEISFSAFKDPSTAFITNTNGLKVNLYVIDTEDYQAGLPDVSSSSQYRSIDISVNFNYVVYNGETYILEDHIDPKAFSSQIFMLPLKDKTKIKGGSLTIATELMKLGLTKIGIHQLKTGITELPNYFLYQCAGITSIDLKGLEQVTKIGSYFMAECAKLKALDLSPLTNITNTDAIGTHFASNCQELLDVNIGNINAQCFQVSETDGSDLYTLSQKESTNKAFGVGVYVQGNDKANFVNRFANREGNNTKEWWRYLMSVEKNVFTLSAKNSDGSEKYDTLLHYEIKHDGIEYDINNLCGEDDAHFNFWADGIDDWQHDIIHENIINLSLRKDIVLNNSSGLIKQYFLAECKILQNFYIKPVSNVKTIGGQFCQYDYHLKDVDFSMFPNLTSIDSNCFLKKCNALTSIDFSVLNDSSKLSITRITKGDPAFCDNYNLMSLNIGKAKANSFDLGDNAFCVRNQVGAITFILGIVVSGDDAEALTVKYKTGFTIENCSNGTEDRIDMHAVCSNDIYIRIFMRNLKTAE